MDMLGVEVGKEATVALSGAGGVGGFIALMRIWRFIRKEFADAAGDKQQADFHAKTISRADYLEKQLDEMRKQLGDQSVALGIARGEASAYKMQVEGITASKDEWKSRALDAAKENTELDKAVSTLSAHLMQLKIKASVASGDPDKESVWEFVAPTLSPTVRERLAVDFKIAQD